MSDPDSQQESKVEPTPGPKALSPRLGTFLTGLAGGLVGGAAIAFLLAIGIAAIPQLRNRIMGDQAKALTAMQRQIDETSQQIATVRSGDNAGGDTATLAKRIDKIESQSHDSTNDSRLTALSQRLDQLSDQIDTVRRSLPPEGTIVALAAQAEEALKTARDIATKRQSTGSLLLVAGQLRDAVERGDPYLSELRAARAVASPDEAPALDALATHAENGVKRRQALLDSFPVMADQAFRAAVLPPSGNQFWRRIKSAAFGIVTLQRTDSAGSDPGSILGRAREAIRRSDIAGAIREMSALTGGAAEASKGWINDASAWLADERALSQIESDLAAQIAKER